MDKINLSAAERLIVAADFKPPPDYPDDSISLVRNEVLILAGRLKGTGVCVKVNSAARAHGYDLITQINLQGLSVFLDGKYCDIGGTLAIDGVLIAEARPRFVTVMCGAGTLAIRALVHNIKEKSPETKILGVTVLTSLTERDAVAIHDCSIDEAVLRLAQVGLDGEVDGFICSVKELPVLRPMVGDDKLLVTPAIRPASIVVRGDDQNQERVATPGDAIGAGADLIVVGRPITQAKDPKAAVQLVVEEIRQATE